MGAYPIGLYVNSTAAHCAGIRGWEYPLLYRQYPGTTYCGGIWIILRWKGISNCYSECVSGDNACGGICGLSPEYI